MTGININRAPTLSPAAFLRRLALGAVLINLFIVAVVALPLLESRRHYELSAEASAHNLSLVLEQNIGGTIEKVDMALLAVSDKIKEYKRQGGIDRDGLNAYIFQQRSRLEELDNLRVINARGEIVYGIEKTGGATRTVADRDYFIRLGNDPLAQLVVAKPVIGAISRKLVISFARRINNPDGSFDGVVLGAVTLEHFLKLFASVNVGKNGAITLRDYDMSIVARYPRPNWTGSLVGQQAVSPELRTLIKTGRRNAVYKAVFPVDQIARMVSFQRVANYPLYINVALATEDYLAGWQREARIMSAVAITFCLFTVLFCLFLYRNFVGRMLSRTALRESEGRFQVLFEHMTEGVALHRLIRDGAEPVNYRIEEVNLAFEKILGLQRDAIIGQPATRVYQLSQAPFLKEYASVVATGTSLVFEAYFPPMEKYFDISAIPWSEDGFATIFSDITERKRTEEARNKAHDFIETLLAASPAGILVYEGLTGKCVLANQAIAEIVGGSPAQIRDLNFRKLDSWQKAGLDQLAEEVLADGQTRHMEKSFDTVFGRTVILDCFFSRFMADEAMHLMVIAIDISEKKQWEEKNRLIEAQMLHVQKLESLGVLAGGIAHDFNNILTAIAGNADLALMRLAPESPARGNLKQIELAVHRAADLARQMLAYSGKGQFVIEELNITTLVEEMAHMLEVSISKKVSLQYDFRPDLPLVSADATQLRQIVMNLVINASEAIEDKSGHIRISTGAMECDHKYLAESWINDKLPEGLYVFLEVSDTGCGIDKDVIPKIFDPFFTTKFTGRGLGMAAVLGIVRGHKGVLKVYSEKGKGTTFKLLLPAGEITEKMPATASAADEMLASGTVLLVDDEESIRAMGREMLEGLGFKVLTAADGWEAVDLFSRNREEIACVLLDLTMPNLDGEQTFCELRRVDPKVRVLMSSGYNEQEVVHKFLGKGLAGFIQKPYSSREMSGKLQKILEGSP